MAKTYILLCDYCNWKRTSDLSDNDLVKVNNDTLSGHKIKCNNCGRAITPRQAKDPQSDVENKEREVRLKDENKKWIEENLKFQMDFLKGKEDERREEN